MSTLPERTIEAKLAAIANHFALGHVQTFERAPGTNQNYLVTTSVGDYLFKIIVNTIRHAESGKVGLECDSDKISGLVGGDFCLFHLAHVVAPCLLISLAVLGILTF